MNVLYFLKNYPKLSESWVRAELAELVRRGHRVAVFSLRAPDEVPWGPAVPWYTPTPFSVADVPRLIRTMVEPSYLDPPLHSLDPTRHAFVRYYASAARSFVDRLPFEVDHIHGHFAILPQVAAQCLARSIGATHTVTTHANDLYGTDDDAIRQYLYRNCDCILTVSAYNASVIEQEAAQPVDPTVLPACFDRSAFMPTGETAPNRLVSVARHVEKKGLRYALQAVAELDDSVEYHIVGDGPRTDDLRSLVTRLGIPDRVSFLGRVSDERLREELDAAALFVLPCVVAQDGDRDGVPVSLKEAMAMGTPPVTTYVSGIPELVDNSNGYLVPPRNVPRLTDALTTGLHDEDNRLQRGDQARARIENHDSAPVMDALLKVFTECRAVGRPV